MTIEVCVPFRRTLYLVRGILKRFRAATRDTSARLVMINTPGKPRKWLWITNAPFCDALSGLDPRLQFRWLAPPANFQRASGTAMQGAEIRCGWKK